MDHEVDKWEISRDRIVLREVIGSGAFGVVWKGILKEAGGGHGRQVIAAKCFTRKNPLVFTCFHNDLPLFVGFAFHEIIAFVTMT